MVRTLVTAVLLMSACTAEPPEKRPADVGNGPHDGMAGDGLAVGGDGGGANSGGGMSDAEGLADDGDRDLGSTGLPNAYQEPSEVRGGVCSDADVPTGACRSAAPAQVYCDRSQPSHVVMAVCSTAGRNQCDALEGCGPGWSACTASQYVARGGRDVPPEFSNTNRAWLAACVQDANGRGLRNASCEPCTEFDPAYDPEVMWWCADGAVVYEGGMDGDKLGVVTSPECFRVGANSPSNSAYWAIDFASGGTTFVVCCEDDF